MIHRMDSTLGIYENEEYSNVFRLPWMMHFNRFKKG